MKYPPAFERLVRSFARLQGIGRKTAERLVFDILARWDKDAVEEFASALQQLPQSVFQCPECRTHIGQTPCQFCSEGRRCAKTLCVVASSKDAYAIESTGQFEGAFFVLTALLSPLDGRGAAQFDLETLNRRIRSDEVEEVILAIDSSLEGDATVSFLTNELRQHEIRISRLASGVPVGTSLEFVDRGTLSRALAGRQALCSTP